MKSLIVLCFPIILGVLYGCGTQPVQLPQKVEVAIQVPCLKKADIPPVPKLSTDAELLAMDRYKRTLVMWAERADRQDYEATLVAVLTACAGG